jgi:hypothetical protein
VEISATLFLKKPAGRKQGPYVTLYSVGSARCCNCRALGNPGLGPPITRLFVALRNITQYTLWQSERLHQSAPVKDASEEMRNTKPRILNHLLHEAQSFLKR